MEQRKLEEKTLHDQLRGDLKSDSYYTSNKKFYTITQSNREFVKNWLLERSKGKRVLDYCCGDGNFAIWLAENGAMAYGIDISPVSIENATNKAITRGLGHQARFLVGDAEATSFSDDFFDFAVVNGALHHLNLERAYSELARILKPDGIVICTEALRHNPLFHLYRKVTPHLRTAWETEHILGKKEIEGARKYFSKVEVLQFFHLATLGAVPFRRFSGFHFLRRCLEAVDSVLLKLPGLKWWAWMAVFVLAEPKKAAGILKSDLEYKEVKSDVKAVA